MKKIKALCFFTISMVSYIMAQNSSVHVNVKADRNPISPYVYGANVPTQHATAIRWGGNRTTTYNWETNYSNAGADYFHTSDNYFTNNLSAQQRTIPGIAVINTVEQAKLRNQYSLITLQAAGYVAADNAGSVTEEQKAPSSRWNAVEFRKDSELSLVPDKTDGKVYIDEFVNYLKHTLGQVGEGGVDGFGIDNEPALWASTHPYIRPNALSLDEFFYKTIEVGSVVKGIARKTEVFGPMFYGWNSMLRLSMDVYTDWSAIRTAKGYGWFVDFYLDSLAKVEQEYGKRILDVLAVHWYPEAKGTVTQKRIVNLDGTATEEQLIAEDMIAARLQAPRSLWDNTYVENSWISQQAGAINIIGRLKQSINTYYPGTKLAFTEFKYDAENHFSGGLSLVDVLGVFGREGVYMANKWDATVGYAVSAYKMYLNYDGAGSKFGPISVQAEVDNNATLSSFASVDEHGTLRLIVINKTATDKTTDFNLAGGYYTNALVYGFGQNNSEITAFDPVLSINDDAFTYTVPAYTALIFEIQPQQQTNILSAKILEENNSVIKVAFDSDIVIQDEATALSEFLVTVQGAPLQISGLTLGVSSSELLITLDAPMSETSDSIYISYEGAALLGKNEIPVADISSFRVNNELQAAPLKIYSAFTSPYGTSIMLEFSKPINETNLSENSVAVLVNATNYTVDSLVLSSENEYQLIAYVSPRILIYDSVKIENTAQTIEAVDGAMAQDFSMSVKNNAPRTSLTIDSVRITDNYTVELYFDMLVQTQNSDVSGLEFFENGVSIPYTIKFQSSVATVRFEQPLFFENTYTMSYYDNAEIMSLYGGYLDGFTDVIIQNNLNPTPASTLIPATIQAENFAYYKGNMQLEASNDEGSGEHVAFIGKNDIYAYYIECATAGDYTITMRHAGASSNGYVSIWVDGKKEANMYVPNTGSWLTWRNSSVAIPLDVGSHTIEIQVEEHGFNFNWFSILEGNNPSNAEITTSFVHTSGTLLYVFYDRKIETLPNVSEIMLTADGVEIPLRSVAYQSSDSVRIVFEFDSVIYKNQQVLLTYNETSAVTTELGSLAPVTEHVVLNSSRETGVEIGKITQNTVHVYPIPAQMGKIITIATCNEQICTYELFSVHGVSIEQGIFSNVHEITVNQSGVYLLNVLCGAILEEYILIVK
ncbi:MAG: carbohydrate-binding protein [Bacteroidales bacterium]|nr:carbohydrate-binding protein [Bacteroidales bacterium]